MLINLHVLFSIAVYLFEKRATTVDRRDAVVACPPSRCPPSYRGVSAQLDYLQYLERPPSDVVAAAAAAAATEARKRATERDRTK